jgi:hypothetical protein
MTNPASSKSLADRHTAISAPIGRRNIVLILFGVLLLVALLYIPLTQAYFLGYDDFFFVHRAVFEDTQHTSEILLKTHSVGGPKYRPLDRMTNFITYRLSRGNPIVYRTRNLIAHLLNCSLVLVLAIVLFDSTLTAVLAALLFGLNPLAHQAVAGAVWTNTIAATMVLIAVILGLSSYKAEKQQRRWLCLAVLATWIGILFYEPDATALGIIALFVVLEFLFVHCVRRPDSWVWTFLLLSIGMIASILVIRAAVLHGARQPLAPIGAIARNAGMYLVAMVLPVDPLLANQWFGTPLISDITVTGKLVAAAAGTVICVLAAIGLTFRNQFRRRTSSFWLMNCLFLLGATGLSIILQLLFADHPSETYLYLPEAFFMLFVAYNLSCLRCSFPRVSYLLAALLLISFACATWERSERVVRSAAIAHHILASLPTSNWERGKWNIRLATPPGVRLPTRYGLYNYSGLDTIGTGVDGIGSIQKALQVRTGNEHGVTVEVLSAERMSQVCNSNPSDGDPCFWVYPNGDVRPAGAD